MRKTLRQFELGRARLRTSCLALLFLAAFATQAFAASFKATLDRDTITLGESATLTLTFVGGQPSFISQPDVPGLEFIDRGSSQNITFVNGQMSATISETIAVTAKQPGNYTIPSVKVQIAGQTFASQPLKLTVLKPGAPPPEAIASGAQPAFMKLLAPKKEFFVGETAVVQVDLYLRSDVASAGQFQFTSLPTVGFTSGKWVQGQQRQTQLGNSIYRVVPLSVALTASSTGTFSLGPITASIIVELPSNRRDTDPYDPFGMFQRHEQRQLTLATDSETVQVLALPTQNQPANFNGVVGDYSMAVTAGPTNLAVGDPITVRVQISGRGALDTLGLPKATRWDNFKAYPPTSKVESSDALGIQGTKTFEEIVTPQSPDTSALPPFAFSFFDPSEKKYRTLTQPAIPLTVRPVESTPLPSLAGNAGRKQENAPASQDIVPIKQRLGTLAQISPPLIQQPWFLGLQGVPALAFVLALGWRKRRESLANNPRLRRQRQVARIVRQGLNDLRKFAAENRSDDFFATLFRILQEQLGERLDVPASSITEAVLEEHLRPNGAPETTLDALHELFQTCNLARYAPIKTSQELAAFIPKTEGVLRELQALKL